MLSLWNRSLFVTAVRRAATTSKPTVSASIKTFEIHRLDANKSSSKLTKYDVDLNKCGPTVLDALMKIKNEVDPTLMFQRSCREGNCGLCTMNIDGQNTLACICNIDTDTAKATKIYPLPHMHAAKDWTPDMNLFYTQYTRMQSWIQNYTSIRLDGRKPDFGVKNQAHPNFPSTPLINSLSTSTALLTTCNLFQPNITSQRFLLAFRRRKMNKHKRKKRFDRDFFKYQKYHAKKKAKAEAIFRQQMQEMMDELQTFDALDYVRTTIHKAKQDYTQSVAFSGRKKYPHWHELISLEELYGIKPDSYIDKQTGRPSEDDEAKCRELRETYFKNYIRKRPPGSTGK